MRSCGRSFRTIDAAVRDSDPPETLTLAALNRANKEFFGPCGTADAALTLEELAKLVAQDNKLRNNWSAAAPNPAAANVREWNALKNLNELNRKFWEAH
jgi:hypothetical protein